LGAPPEDDPGTPGDGAPETAIPPQLSEHAQLSERARSLAARVDAMLESDEARTEAALDIDELEEVEEVPEMPAPRASAPFRPLVPTPPPGPGA